MSDNFILNLTNEVSYGFNYLLKYVSGCIIMTRIWTLCKSKQNSCRT